MRQVDEDDVAERRRNEVVAASASAVSAIAASAAGPSALRPGFQPAFSASVWPLPLAELSVASFLCWRHQSSCD